MAQLRKTLLHRDKVLASLYNTQNTNYTLNKPFLKWYIYLTNYYLLKYELLIQLSYHLKGSNHHAKQKDFSLNRRKL